MLEKDCHSLGYILRTHGVKGELKVKTNFDISEDICQKWESVFFRIDGMLIPFFIEHIIIQGSRDLLIKFEDIDEEDAQYKGLELLIDKSLLNTDSVESNLTLCVGYSVFDNDLKIGELSDVLEYPAQQMFEVKTEEDKHLLIPANIAWIERIDNELQQIRMNLPEGLLEIND